jgi:hypothetical protein
MSMVGAFRRRVALTGLKVCHWLRQCELTKKPQAHYTLAMPVAHSSTYLRGLINRPAALIANSKTALGSGTATRLTSSR